MNASTPQADLTALRASYLAAQLAGDRREALRLVLEEVDRSGDVSAVQTGVVQEAQREIGRLWQENRISVAQEHMATAIAHIVLAHLYDHARRGPDLGKRIVVACVEGELHDFPARLVADALDLAGFEVRFLGANVPVESLVDAVLRERPDLVALSTTMTFNVPALRVAVARVREATGGRVPIAVGGGACAWGSRVLEEIAPEVSGRDVAEILQATRTLFGLVEGSAP